MSKCTLMKTDPFQLAFLHHHLSLRPCQEAWKAIPTRDLLFGVHRWLLPLFRILWLFQGDLQVLVRLIGYSVRIQSRLSLQTSLSSSSVRSFLPNRSHHLQEIEVDKRSQTCMVVQQEGHQSCLSSPVVPASHTNGHFEGQPFASSMQMMTTPFFSCAIQNFGSSPEKRCATKVFAR